MQASNSIEQEQNQHENLAVVFENIVHAIRTLEIAQEVAAPLACPVEERVLCHLTLALSRLCEFAPELIEEFVGARGNEVPS